MHDCLIVKSGFIGKDFYMDIKSDSFCVFGKTGELDATIEKLTFVNAEILENDSDIDLGIATWLCNEVYLRESQYEMQILFWAKNNEIAEMAIAFDDIIIEGNWETDDV